ncbi:hypothetical protein ASPWEDRAFT_40051 [Aspergillus wentii DTO 134E9]|uniref:Uncharacterized protein n=1 Tax=Aspergillus wentii DTO 134E9 TaxID=1073089 RepID=A0A1L9RJ18_ASPWE|nr:uncharacterized protein ASPWEDRAFT_40051 [Aspergillus wentii DTO 134E9]KAI9932114.1 hypothetical protein MW887_009623 [Aspergillus wentii]OJJ34930.1 hypothetical protein ASPWEDRAFT_40051 [Aspergillus wentii DTO 134E9]
MSSTTIQNVANNDTLSKRRRFQPPITSFFSSPASNENTPPHLSHNHYSARTNSPTPAVPDKVQASLMSVGMRVRKSIAEGYKTLGAKKLENSVYADQDQKPRYPSSHAELAPFGGMFKPGDNAVQPLYQPSYQSSDSPDIITDENDAFSLPPSSQESAASFAPLKRSFDDDIDELEDEDEQTYQDTNLSHGRTILTPTLGNQRRRFIAMEYQNKMDLDDFEEPSFLRRREEVDSDYTPKATDSYDIGTGGAIFR